MLFPARDSGVEIQKKDFGAPKTWVQSLSGLRKQRQKMELRQLQTREQPRLKASKMLLKLRRSI